MFEGILAFALVLSMISILINSAQIGRLKDRVKELEK